jgi:L-malate glycosyltransferase
MATYNGDSTLPEVLTAYTKLEQPAKGWRLVIVDNGSTEATRRVIDTYASQLPLTCLVEPRPGKNAALNTALSAIAGDLVVLTDDDIVPRSDWLCRFRHTADTQPEFHVFGGHIVPRWPATPAPWLLASVPLGPAFGVSPSLPTGPVAANFVFGGNMAVRADVFSRGFRFDASIGPRPGQYAQGSEAELTRRLASAGYRAWYCQEAVAEHIVRPYQLTKPWLAKRAQRYGRGQFRLQQREQRPSWLRRVADTALIFAQLSRHSLRLMRRYAGTDPQAQLAGLWTWNLLLGQLKEAVISTLPQRRLSRTGWSA